MAKLASEFSHSSVLSIQNRVNGLHDVRGLRQTRADGWQHLPDPLGERICPTHRSHPYIETTGELAVASHMFTEPGLTWGMGDQCWKRFTRCLQNPISGLLHEMESILAEQKTVSCWNEKSKWWEGRKALDSRVEVSCKRQASPLQSKTHKWKALGAPLYDWFFFFFFFSQKLLKDMESLLGGWRSLLLPLASDPEISRQAQQLCRALSVKGVAVSEDMLKVWCTALFHIRKTRTRASISYWPSLSGFRLCCLLLLGWAKKISSSLPGASLQTGTRSATVFFTRPSLRSRTRRSLKITWCSSWTRLD